MLQAIILAQREDLYPINNPIIKPVAPDVSSTTDASGLLLFSNVIYSLALFALVWTIYYFCLNYYQFDYFTKGKKTKEFANEWRGLQHMVTNYRLCWTLLILQFPLALFSYVSSFSDSILTAFIGIIFIIFFIIKIFLDMTHLYRISDYFKDFQFVPLGDQIGIMFSKFIKIFQAPKKPPEKPAGKGAPKKA
jgi:hypothetical protein